MKIKLPGITDGNLDRFRDILVGGPVTRFPFPPGYRRGDLLPPEFLNREVQPMPYRPRPITQLPTEVNPAPIAPPELAPAPPPVNKLPPRFSGIRSMLGRGRK